MIDTETTTPAGMPVARSVVLVRVRRRLGSSRVQASVVAMLLED